MSALTAHLIIPALNHLLSNESWATARLVPYVNKTLLVVAPPFQLLLEISQNGKFSQVVNSGCMPDVTITLPNDSAGKILLGDHAAAFSAAKLSGSADLAEAIAFVFRNLQWDAEADLASFIGDIPARRGMMVLKNMVTWKMQSALNFAQNAKEFVTDELQLVMNKNEVLAFANQVDTLRDDLARLEKRVGRL